MYVLEQWVDSRPPWRSSALKVEHAAVAIPGPFHHPQDSITHNVFLIARHGRVPRKPPPGRSQGDWATNRRRRFSTTNLDAPGNRVGAKLSEMAADNLVVTGQGIMGCSGDEDGLCLLLPRTLPPKTPHRYASNGQPSPGRRPPGPSTCQSPLVTPAPTTAGEGRNSAR